MYMVKLKRILPDEIPPDELTLIVQQSTFEDAFRHSQMNYSCETWEYLSLEKVTHSILEI